MSFQALPMLQQLAIQGLLSNEDLALSALEDLPNVLFPPLFKEAFIQRRTKIVKHMVTTWPYPHLYIGPLMNYYHIDTFRAVLNGMDWLNSQKVRPRRCRLRELNLLNVQHDFLEIWTPSRDLLRVSQPQSEKEDQTLVNQPLRVHADYVFLWDILNQHHEDFMQWVRERKDTMLFSFYRLVPKKK